VKGSVGEKPRGRFARFWSWFARMLVFILLDKPEALFERFMQSSFGWPLKMLGRLLKALGRLLKMLFRGFMHSRFGDLLKALGRWFMQSRLMQSRFGRLCLDFQAMLKQGVKDAQRQWRLVRRAQKIAPYYFQALIRRILWMTAEYFIFLAILITVEITLGPVNLFIQGLAVLGSGLIPGYYGAVANPMLQFDKTHGGTLEIPAEVSAEEWRNLYKKFWLGVPVGAGGMLLFSNVSTWLARVFQSKGLLSVVPINACSESAQAIYGQTLTVINGLGTRKLDEEATQSRKAGKEARKGITWSQRRANRRQAAPFMHPVWPWMVVGFLLLVIPPLWVLMTPVPSSGALVLTLVFFLPFLVTMGVKGIIEDPSSRGQHWATKGYFCALWPDYLWKNALNRYLLRVLVLDVFCKALPVNGIVTLVLDAGLGNHSPLLHTSLTLALGVFPGAVLSSLMAGGPAYADQVVGQAAGQVPSGTGDEAEDSNL
jgi:hypothetical protein